MLSKPSLIFAAGALLNNGAYALNDIKAGFDYAKEHTHRDAARKLEASELS